MATCLSAQELESYVAGSASSEQIATWGAHLPSDDACAVRACVQSTGEESDQARVGRPKADDWRPATRTARVDVDRGAVSVR